MHHYHHPAPYPPGPENGLGTAAFVGPCACVFSFIPVIGLIARPVPITGTGLSIAALHKVRTGAATNEVPVLAGLVLSLVALVIRIGRVAMMFDVADQKQEILRIADMGASENRWPHYVPQACALDIGSMMGSLLFTTRENFGMLNLSSSKPEAFTQRSEKVGWVFASHAAVAFASARNDAQLHQAITTRQGIGEAMGVIMNRYKISGGQAFEVLKRVSQHRNVKLREVAQEVAETGEVPGAEDR